MLVVSRLYVVYPASYDRNTLSNVYELSISLQHILATVNHSQV